MKAVFSKHTLFRNNTFNSSAVERLGVTFTQINNSVLSALIGGRPVNSTELLVYQVMCYSSGRIVCSTKTSNGLPI